MLSKDKTAMLLAEFFGAFVLTGAVLGITAKLGGVPFFGALTAGVTLSLVVMMIGNISGGHANPAVTLGLWSIKKVPTTQAIVFVASQLLGGLAAWRVAEYLLDQKLGRMAESAFDWRIVIAEAVGAFIFTFAIAAALSQKFEGGRLASTIGLALFVGAMVAGMGSAGLLNPAVALGLNSYSVNYIVGPIAGGILGMNVYEYVFATKAPAKKKRK